MSTASGSTPVSGNPTALAATGAKIGLAPDLRVELTNNAPIATAATSMTPFGTATADQMDDLIATVIQMRAALVSVGICIDATANAD